MSNKPSQPSGERTTSSRTSAVQRSTEPTTSRKRSNTKYGVQPAIHLSLKTSTSALPRLQSHGGVNLNYDLQQATFGKRSAGSSSPSTASPSTGRSAGYSPSSNGSHTPASPLTASPDHMSMFSGFGDTISSSLPLSLSALWTEPSLDLVSPSPSSVSSSRRPSLSPYAHGHQVRSQPALAQSRSSNNLRLAAHRLPSDPASRKSSITSVERDAGLHLDMKRLLSKPAQPTHSGSSIMSLGSDSEPLRSPMYPGSLSRQPSSRRTATGPLPDERTRRPTEDTATLRKSASRASLHASALQQQQPQKQRNVLRRKASATSNPATPTAQTFHQQQQQPGARISLKSFVRASVAAPPARRATHDVATTTTTSELPRRHKSPPVNLTPAGAVAHAYKQQARRRSELAEMSGGSSGDLRDGSVDSRRTTRVAADGDEGEESGGAYYTVLGGSAGRLIAVGSVEDSMWEFGYDARYGVDERFRQARVSSSGSGGAGVRGLGRKVSGKFKRPGSTKEHRRAHADELLDRRPKTSPGSSSSRPLGPSMDEYVDVNQQVCSGTAIPSAPNGTPEDKTLRSVRSFKGKEPDSNSKGSGDDSSPGGKIWKLMKRISTGALREKYHDATPPPPVPALPDDYKHLASPRTTLDIRKGRDDASETGISRFMNSRTSLSAVRPSTAPVRSSPRTTTDSSRPSTGPRHSTTTRSSSPMSSEVASSRYFQKSHSTHSSISSYGEELPPLPKPSSSNVGQHIMTPGELYSKLGGDELVLPKPHQQSRSRTRSLGGEGAPRPPSDIRPSLPPPRRSHTAGSKPAAADAHSHPPSPLIPAFDTTEPTNHFGTLSSQYSLPTSEFGVLNDDAPQRPKRSSRRKPPPFDLAVQTGPPVTPRTPRSPHAPPTITVDDGRSLDRKSLAGSMQSTIHDRDTLYSPSPTSATASHFRTPLRFREIDSPRVQLSEREKAAKWDDLLMRSEQAGGTLHLGDSGLMSDNVRFSEYSVSESPP